MATALTPTYEELIIWLVEQTWSDFAQSLVQYAGTKGELTPKQEASARKMYATVTAKKAPQPTQDEVVISEGIYSRDGKVYKVVYNKAKTSLYAKELVEDNLPGDAPTYSWEYCGKKPLYTLTEADRISADEASHLGHLYGVCVFCSITLTDERSVTVGYGPICAANHGLPWGGTTVDQDLFQLLLPSANLI